jgi:hypothetical protein
MRTTERLSDLIAKKHEVLLQLRDVGRRQMDFVNGGDVAALLALLGTKQQLIAGLQTLEQELNEYYAEDPDRRVWPSSQKRAECARQAAACNTLLEEIVAMEKMGAEKMTVRRNEVAEQLQQAHAATQVCSAYEANRRRAS